MICKATSRQIKLIPKQPHKHISQGTLESVDHLALCKYIFIAPQN